MSRSVFIVMITAFLLAFCLNCTCLATEEASADLDSVGYPAWSPDGSHIAMQRSRGPNSSDIWIVHPNGTGLQRITTDDYVNWYPQWSRDSLSLFWLSVRPAGREIRRKPITGGSESRVKAPDTPGYAVSHDGASLVVELTRGDTIGLALVSPKTGKELSWVAAGRPGMPVTGPVWSPNDEEMAYFKGEQLWACRISPRGDARQITSSLGSDRVVGSADWGSNDLIVFDSQERIYTVRPDGSKLTCLYKDPHGWACDPRWSPDGKKIAFWRLLEGSCELWTMNANGSALTQITHTTTSPTFSAAKPGNPLTITCATKGAIIRYTIDGSEPTEKSPRYTKPIKPERSRTLKAKAWKTGCFPSLITQTNYKVDASLFRQQSTLIRPPQSQCNSAAEAAGQPTPSTTPGSL